MGELDLRGLLLALPSDIPIAVEIPNSRLAAQMSDTERARRALVATEALVAEFERSSRTDGKFRLAEVDPTPFAGGLKQRFDNRQRH